MEFTTIRVARYNTRRNAFGHCRRLTVPFRPSPKTPKGKIVWREVKIALLARLAKHQTKTKETVTRLHQRWLVAVLGIDALKPRLQQL